MNYKVQAFAAIAVSAVLFVAAGYFIPRGNFALFFGCYTALFGLFYLLWLNYQQFSFRHFLIIAVAFRLILLFATPELSNDFYRFFWDGELITRGINPYAHTPFELSGLGRFSTSPYMVELYEGMGTLSQHHYSCYPPLNQVFFVIPAAVSDCVPANLVVLKLIIILADTGAILVGKKILEHLKMETHKIWLFGLNPFVILEFSGNVHFEGVMIFFLLCSVYFLLKENWLMSAIFIGFAIHIKLIPLLLIPFLLKKLKWRRSMGYLAMTTISVLLVGQLFLNKLFFTNMLNSINSYFISFEFNASVFYIFREAGFMVNGYDMIATFGPLLSKVAMAGILLLAILRSYKTDRDIFVVMLFGLTLYYALATTVHPWYISMLLILSVFTHYRFALIWSFLVMLSYSAYAGGGFHENAVLLCTEYGILAAVIVYELKRYRRKDLVDIGHHSFFGVEK